MSNKTLRLLLTALLALLAARLFGAPIQEQEIPDPLKPWRAWVSWSHKDLACPFLSTGSQRSCVWAKRLELDLAQTGGRFRYGISVFTESWVTLPGDIVHWPSKLLIDGAPGVLLEQKGKPAVRLAPGSHQIDGEFRWPQLPDTLKIPAENGIVALRLHDRQVTYPVIKEGSLWLKSQGESDARRQPQERVALKVFRLLDNDHPFAQETELVLQIAGAQRELVLGKPLLAGFIPTRIDSPLPARLEANGELRIQARPGSWRLRIHGRHVAPVSRLQADTQPPPWPAEEIWVFRAKNRLRVVEVSGPPQIDPRQVDLPDAWSSLPTYRVTPDSVMTLQEIRRANQEPEPDQLKLQRDIWLDFDAEGYTLRDHITGSITSSWRLAVDPALRLGRVTLNGRPQFITRLADSSTAGVEVRQGDLDLTATLRVTGDALLPASGWVQEFRQIDTTLHLPPGWRLLAVTGVDNLPRSWLQKWTLYDLFLVLIVGLAAGRLWGWVWSLPVLLTLTLTWHEPLAPQMVWLYLLASIALSRVAPAGKMTLWLRGLRLVGYLALLLIIIPFAVHQARLGLHPQLERYGMTQSYTVLDDRRQGMPEIAVDTDEADRFQLYSKGSSPLQQQIVRETMEKQAETVGHSDLVQTGPGLPLWEWNRFHLSWNGPVAREQSLGLYMLSPWQTSLWRFLAIGLVLLTAWRLLDRDRRRGLRLPRVSQLMLAALALPFALTLPHPALAGNPEPPATPQIKEAPGQALLDELERRLSLPPECLPECVSIQEMQLVVDGAAYRASLTVHALEAVGLPLPVDVNQVSPLRVRLDDGRPARLLRAENQLWLNVPQGISRVELEVGLPPQTQVAIPLPLKPHHIRVEAKGWSVEGLDKQRQTGSQLTLIRLQEENQGKEDAAEFATGNALPPFFRVERTLHLGNSWSITTRLVRRTPSGSPVTLRLPLLANESVISEGIQVKEGIARVSLTADQRELSWRSNLSVTAQIQLTAPQTEQWMEQWSVDVGPLWHLSTEGIPPVQQQDREGSWLPTWQPWPGERLTLTIERPEGIEGNTQTLIYSRLAIEPGQRVTHHELNLRLRSSRGGQHRIQLPADAQIQAVDIGGPRVSLPLEQGGLTLPVIPGEQNYTVIWRQPAGIGGRWHSAPLSLGIESVNAQISVKLPQDRWLLWAGGPRLGPAILFWSLLLVVLLAALILGRATRSFLPLSTLSWFLLGIGLTQVTVFAGLAVIAWFLLLHYRAKLDAQSNENLFNIVQTGVVLLTLIFIAILFWSVQQGLLGYPAMQVQGNGSSAYRLNWYQDRLTETYPQVSVISVPLLIYRGLMLAWALWLAFSLLSWLKWGWAAFAKDGVYWRRSKINPAARRKSKNKPLQDKENEAPPS